MPWIVLASAIALASCEVKLNAVDLKKTGTTTTVSGSGCTNAPNLFSANVEAKDYQQYGEGCVESVEDLVFDFVLDAREPGAGCDAPRGTITLHHLSLGAAKGPKEIQITCPSSQLFIEDPDGLRAAVNGCAAQNEALLTEWLRQALNARADEISVKAVGSCDANACFNVRYSIRVRFTKPIIYVGKPCTEKRAPLE